MTPARPEELLAELNDEQSAAVQKTEGPVLILAGAGSGKTRVITYRIAYLVLSGRAAPSEILAVTFTNKAAGEMRSRVETLLGVNLSRLWILTFHAFGARVLRGNAEAFGRTPGFIIYDDDDSERLVKQCMNDLHVDPKRLAPGAFLDWLEHRKLDLLLHPESVPGGTFVERTFAGLHERYAARLKEADAFDFGDLVCRPVQLFEQHPDVAERFRNRFRYVLVDEYQDTNHAQYVLLRHLCGEDANLCVVGDDDQSIYGWRGADIRNILEFEQDFGKHRIHVCHLVRNYRSPRVILDAANALIRNNESRRKEKGLWTDREGTRKILYFNAATGGAEAGFVAQLVSRAVRYEGRRYSEFAVFYRTHAQSRLVEQACMQQQIPYRVFGGTKFFERREVKDLLSYLRLVQNPLDEVSLLRVVNVPRRGVGAKTIHDWADSAHARGVSLWSLLAEPPFPKAASAKLTAFRKLVEGLQEQAKGLGPRAVLDLVIHEVDYLRYLEDDARADRVDVVKELVSHAVEFERRSDEPTLAGFLEDVALVSPIDELDPESGTVTLMTLHNAKGLEFPYVFMIGMEEGLFPHSNALEDPERLEEERRLCYVGITRTRERLFLCGARERLLYGRVVYNIPSRFLREVGPDVMECCTG